MSAYLSDDEENIYTNDDLEMQDLESKLTDEELLELQLAEEEYKRQEALSIEEDRLLSIRKESNCSFVQKPTNKKEDKKKDKNQKKKGISLEEFNKKIEDSAPKKFVSQRVLEKNPDILNQVKQKEVIQTNMRRFNPRLPPFLKRSL
jgi:hypothetical protein